MFAFPMLIVWIILAGVLICVMAGAIVTKVRGGSIGANPLTLLAVTIFVTSVLGYYVTGFASPTPETWSHALIVRVLWQFGGGVFVALAVVIEGRGSLVTWILGLVFLGLGFLMGYNPLLDLVHGPLLLRGKAHLTVTEIHRNTRGGDAIWANLVLTATDGTPHTINMAGWGATEAMDKLDECENTDNVELLVLPRLQRVIEARCAPSDSDH